MIKLSFHSWNNSNLSEIELNKSLQEREIESNLTVYMSCNIISIIS